MRWPGPLCLFFIFIAAADREPAPSGQQRCPILACFWAKNCLFGRENGAPFSGLIDCFVKAEDGDGEQAEAEGGHGGHLRP